MKFYKNPNQEIPLLRRSLKMPQEKEVLKLINKKQITHSKETKARREFSTKVKEARRHHDNVFTVLGENRWQVSLSS